MKQQEKKSSPFMVALGFVVAGIACMMIFGLVASILSGIFDLRRRTTEDALQFIVLLSFVTGIFTARRAARVLESILRNTDRFQKILLTSACAIVLAFLFPPTRYGWEFILTTRAYRINGSVLLAELVAIIAVTIIAVLFLRHGDKSDKN